MVESCLSSIWTFGTQVNIPCGVLSPGLCWSRCIKGPVIRASWPGIGSRLQTRNGAEEPAGGLWSRLGGGRWGNRRGGVQRQEGGRGAGGGGDAALLTLPSGHVVLAADRKGAGPESRSGPRLPSPGWEAGTWGPVLAHSLLTSVSWVGAGELSLSPGPVLTSNELWSVSSTTEGLRLLCTHLCLAHVRIC